MPRRLHGKKGSFGTQKSVNETDDPGYSAIIKVSSSKVPSWAPGLPSFSSTVNSYSAFQSEEGHQDEIPALVICSGAGKAI